MPLTYKLLDSTPYASQQQAKLSSLDYSASVIAYYFCLDKELPGLRQHNIFVSGKWWHGQQALGKASKHSVHHRPPAHVRTIAPLHKNRRAQGSDQAHSPHQRTNAPSPLPLTSLPGQFRRSWERATGVASLLPRPNFYVHCPSRTDASAAPPGCDSLMVLLPVGNMQEVGAGARGGGASLCVTPGAVCDASDARIRNWERRGGKGLVMERSLTLPVTSAVTQEKGAAGWLHVSRSAKEHPTSSCTHPGRARCWPRWQRPRRVRRTRGGWATGHLPHLS